MFFSGKKIPHMIFALFAAIALASCGQGGTESGGCASKIENINIRKIDEVVITSGNDPGTGVVTDREEIKKLAEAAQSLTFELNTNKYMTLGEMYTIKFMDGDEEVHRLSFDNDGVFWFDETPGCYEKTGGDIDYDMVERLFSDNYVEAETEPVN